MNTDALSEIQAPPLVARLVEQFGARWLDAGSAERLTVEAADAGDQVLFFSGDPVRFPECLDVAVVLPELQAAFPGRFGVHVVLPRDEDAVARRWGVQRWPSLVFLRGGRYVTTIAGMLNWADYVARVGEALAMPVSRAPTVGIPVLAGTPSSSCH